ncbi:MAG: DNA translocase FtsK 4TM domain-containing protein [Parcubacteria group bacterium]|jgi:S-DNA-T family DNA segregation ATPase FtsK/SpoIIIE
MGRKKKEEKNRKQEALEEAKKPKFSIGGDVKRSILAVFLFALALVMLLGFFDAAGMVGQFLDERLAGALIGWAKFVSPLFLILAGLILLLRKETGFYITKIIGLIIIFVSLTGFFHWLFALDQMAEAARAGTGGGYIGYGVAYAAVKLLGNAGGLVVIVAFFLIGIIVAFNFSIAHFFEKLFAKKEAAEDGVEFVEDGSVAAEKINERDAVETQGLASVQADPADPDSNIGKIEFVEGRDQFVDEKLLTGIAHKEFSVKGGAKDDFAEKNPGTIFSHGNGNWKFPPVTLLEKSSGEAKGGDVEKNAETIEKTLRYFGIEVERGEIQTGPAVTQYSFRPAVGVKISRILALQNDLALALAKHPIRIEAPIPGKSLIGIEVPNTTSAIVRLRDILEGADFKNRKSNLTLALGEDVSGTYAFGNLDKMPHLMIAGATGTGKSVGINSVITTLLYQNSPDDLKFIMVDPKRVELSLYNGIPHLLCDVIVDNGKVVSALKWAVGEMERRYRSLQDSGSRDIASYNEKIKAGHKTKYTDFDTGEIVEKEFEKLPYIVIIIDELADLMGSHGKEVEGAVVRLAQMARAVGIHLIVSTQRPSVEVITGLIKANITTRVAFQVATQIDSRTILDMSGAEKLLGNGDMLYLSASSPKPKRVQGVFVSEKEVKDVVKFIKDQKYEHGEDLGENITSPAQGGGLDFKNTPEGSQDDDLYESAKEEVTRAGKASASLLQRRLRVGYSRAARLLDILEDNGVIGPSDGAKPREVYAAKDTPAEAIAYDDAVTDQTVRDKWQM